MAEAHRTWAEIDRRALIQNARTIRSLLGKGVLMLAVVKANAYGHGMDAVSTILKGEADWFGVDSLDEAIALRKLGVEEPILILGFTPMERAAEVVRYDLRQIVHNLEAVGALDDASRHIGKQAIVHIKIETGMARQGIRVEDLPHFLAALPEFTGVSVEGISTHLANADDVDDPSFRDLQLTRFHAALDTCERFGTKPKIRHVTASAGTMIAHQAHFDLVRVGISLYGIWPAPHLKHIATAHGKEITLNPALRLCTRVAQVSTVEDGASVGYGLTEQVKRPSRVAVLPIGYADGYDYRLSSKGEVLLHGRRAKILGTVMMNIVVVDVTDIPSVAVGSVATVIGADGDDEITAQEIAEKIGGISYEVVARINPLLPRVVV